MKRRDFMNCLMAGGTIAGMPALLGACAVEPMSAPTSDVPVNPFLQWFGIDESMLSRAMSVLTANGAEAANIFFQYRRGRHLTLRDGRVGPLVMDVVQGVGLRVRHGENYGFASTEDLTMESLLRAARMASHEANRGARSTMADFVMSPAGTHYQVADDWSVVDDDRLPMLLNGIEAQARRGDPTVDTVIANWSDIDEHILVATHDGRIIKDRRPMTRLTLQVGLARSAQVQSGFAGLSGRRPIDWYDEKRVDDLVSTVLQQAGTAFDARRPPSGEMPVILAAGGSGILLHEAVGHSLEADFNLKGSSPYAGRMNSQVGNPLLTLKDQGTMDGERGALNYDDEGTPCSENVLIDKGVLRSYLHDSTTAAKYQVDLTGSARRESFRHQPMPRMTCTWLQNGPHTRDEIIAATARGIIAETFTDGRVTLGEGDFEFTVKSGWLVEKGKITAPLKDLVVRGNGPQMLHKITMVADDLRLASDGWTCGKNGQVVPVSLGMPTVLVSSMMVGDRLDSAAGDTGLPGQGRLKS